MMARAAASVPSLAANMRAVQPSLSATLTSAPAATRSRAKIASFRLRRLHQRRPAVLIAGVEACPGLDQCADDGALSGANGQQESGALGGCHAR